MSLDGTRSTVIFYDLVYLENFVLITRGFHPLLIEFLTRIMYQLIQVRPSLWRGILEVGSRHQNEACGNR